MAITWWDLCDDGSWIPDVGMLRKDLSPKPVYTALKELIRKRWTTKTEGKTDADGRFSFTGFHGEYAARISRNGKVIEQSFHVGRQKRNTVNIVLGNE